MTPREKLDAVIAARVERRGRNLTAREQLEALVDALRDDDDLAESLDRDAYDQGHTR